MAAARQRRYYQRQPKGFKIEDLVWLFTPTLGVRGTHKMMTNWSGPWLVIKRVNDLMYTIKATEHLNYEGQTTVSIDRLRLYVTEADQPVPLPVASLPLDMAGNETVETIPMTGGVTMPGKLEVSKAEVSPPRSAPSASNEEEQTGEGDELSIPDNTPLFTNNTLDTSDPTMSPSGSSSSSSPNYKAVPPSNLASWRAQDTLL